ncbi:hypothetical protein KKI17_01990 [Patescibacteria group bacterium]|nr:hypothetical protein [Patescibacteria group bacterium]
MTHCLLRISPVFLLLVALFWGALLFFEEEFVQAGSGDNVEGWAWADAPIGWISFNSTTDGGPINYGVNVDGAAGEFSGYAWSETLGWIRFNPNGPFPELPNYSACFDAPGSGQECDGVGDYTVSGWARACAGAVDMVGCAETFSVSAAVGTKVDGNIHTNPMATDSEFLYLAGSDASGWRIEKRRKSDGELVEAIHINGWQNGVIQEPITGVAASLEVDGSYLYIGGNSGGDFRLEKRDKITGELLVAENGRSVPLMVDARLLEIDQDANALYVLGAVKDVGAWGESIWRLEKRGKGDLLPDPNFGDDLDGDTQKDGALLGTFTGFAQALEVSDGAVFSGGYENVLFSPIQSQWRLEKRSTADGSLDMGFDGDGFVQSAPIDSGQTTYLLDIITKDGDNFLYSLGRTNHDPGESNPVLGDKVWRIEKRNKITGLLINSFDGNGILEEDPSIQGDYIFAGAYDAQYLYLFGIQGNTNNKWRIEKRDKDTGSPIKDFGKLGDGSIIVDFSGTNSEWTEDIAIDSGYIYLFGLDFSVPQWRVEKRDIEYGGLNWPTTVSYVDADRTQSALFEANPNSGGWDGWIKLRDDAKWTPGVSWDFVSKEFSGWAWGGGTVLGWISFNCATDGSCGSSDYKVSGDIPLPPVAALSCNPSFDGSNTAGLVCDSNPGSTWVMYNGTYDFFYDLRSENSTDPNNDIWKSTFTVGSFSVSCIDNAATPLVNEAIDPTTCSPEFNGYVSPGSYTAELTVEDSAGNTDIDTHLLEVKQDAIARFECSKDGIEWTIPCVSIRIAEDEVVYFRGDDGAGGLSSPSDGSAISTWSWDFPDGNPANAAISGFPTPIEVAFGSTGNKLVELIVGDNVGRQARRIETLGVTVPFPEWKEIIPLP